MLAAGAGTVGAVSAGAVSAGSVSADSGAAAGAGSAVTGAAGSLAEITGIGSVLQSRSAGAARSGRQSSPASCHAASERCHTSARASPAGMPGTSSSRRVGRCAAAGPASGVSSSASSASPMPPG
ncbi:MAG TPA: hypothetical protein VGF32_26425 [Streptosporangiaceae bacterium]